MTTPLEKHYRFLLRSNMPGHFPRFPGMLLRKTTSPLQGFAASTAELVTWGIVDYDPDGLFDGLGTFTAPYSGLYLCVVHLVWASDSGGNYRQIYVKINSTLVGGEVWTAGETSDFSCRISHCQVL